MKLFGIILSFVAATAIAACGGGATATLRPSVAAPASAATVAPASPSTATSTPPAASVPAESSTANADLCLLLTANDWAQVLLSQAGAQPTISADESGAHCVYDGTSGATGGLEFDAFPAPDTAAAEETFNTISSGLPGGEPVDLPGVDAALINTDVDGKFGAIVVRDGRFTYTISLPTSDGAKTQLETLASLVLLRDAQYK